MAVAIVKRKRSRNTASKAGLLKRIVRSAVLAIIGLYTLALISLVALRWINPPFTAVHIERRLQALVHGTRYQKQYDFVPLRRISADFQHAVIAAEDTRFYQHHGFDWVEIRDAVEDEFEEGHARGASTITQQLVKNLFLSTSRSVVRKGIEATIVPFAEVILGKRRILELYINVVEWGPGIYGAEAAAKRYYHVPAAGITREQGARLAAMLPSPLSRKPGRLNHYSARILERMAAMGW